KMIDDQPANVDQQAFLYRSGHNPMSQIPCRDVITRISKDPNAFEYCGRQVYPPLVGEDSVVDVVVTEIVQSVGPPICEGAAVLVISDAKKPKIVNSVAKRRYLVFQDFIQSRPRRSDV